MGVAQDPQVELAARYAQDPKFMALLGRLQPTSCEGSTPNVSRVEEVDLFKDGGAGELLVSATSCKTYSSGADLNLVVWKKGNDDYAVLRINNEFVVGNRSWLEAEGNTLVLVHAVYRPEDAGCCPSGGTDREYLRWKGDRFVSDKVVHVSPRP